MSLFRPFMDFEEDVFGAHMRSMQHMNDMMNSMFSNPFGMMRGMGMPALEHSSHTSSGNRDLMPFGFPNMNSIFQNFDNLGEHNGHSYSSRTVMTMSSGPDGRPQVYQASSTTRTAPGGVKEVKKSVSDSRSGVKKLAVGHHIGERAHYVEREQNFRSGEQEERQEFINLEEEEAEDFNKEFEQKTKHAMNAVTYPSRHARRHRELPALPSSRCHEKYEPRVTQPHNSVDKLKSEAKRNDNGKAKGSRVRSRAHASNSRRNHPALPAPPSSGAEKSRKRDHEPDASAERTNKALKPSPKN